jgi:PEP-CTERM motif-containing protein
MRFTLSPRVRPAGAVLACLAIFGTAPAKALTVALGNIASDSAFAISNTGLSGPLADSYTFSIASDGGLVFTGSLETPMSNRFWIDDLDATLVGSGGPVAEGDSRQMTDPFPSTSVSFSAITLGAGDYVLNVFGNATSAFPGPTSTYAGVLSFTQVTPVPEPSATALMMLGLAGLGVQIVRRRSRVD